MVFEKEYAPREPIDDKVYILHGGAAEELIVPDDDGDSIDEEGVPEGATSGSKSTGLPRVAATAKQELPTNEEEAPNVEYD